MATSVVTPTSIYQQPLADDRCSVPDRLKDLTRSYFAVEGLIQSPLLSEETREKLERFLAEINDEMATMLRDRRRATTLSVHTSDVHDKAA